MAVKEISGGLTTYTGLSTDVKPRGTDGSGAPEGNAMFLELDTGDLYYFSAGTWAKVGG